MKKTGLKIFFMAGIVLLCLLGNMSAPALAEQAQTVSRILSLIQEKDAVLLTDPQGKILASGNAEKLLVPASTLKILTALVALHYLGEDFRFVTECYSDKDNNLKIKGFGDPLFVSDMMPDFSRQVQSRMNYYKDLVLDDSVFQQPLRIPGVTETAEPYDAPNGAFCANFNTISFQKTSAGKYISAEPQTPLVPFALSRIRASKTDSGRIVFSHSRGESVLYAGHLVAGFLSRQGVASSGQVRIGRVDDGDRLLIRYVSPYALTDVISRLMEYSNNFIANQLFIAAGIRAYGLPGTIDKGIRASQEFLRKELRIETLQLAEGSGISRENRLSAIQLDQLLIRFYPYRQLMRRQGNELYKTGTLNGIRSRAGYIEDGKGGSYRFVVMINTPGKTADPVMEIIRGLAGS
ncbi:MAG: D-alanyl-D-alanine carboxypeptidase [Desulfatirhabdiaceae bacterium]|nr:D-alanyl-D-alanine carboxypeptidase [Desulfatirhabdiaceae bacterium]